MKTFLSILLVASSVNLFSQTLEKLWETDSVLAVPESVLFTESELYVSNVSGNPDEKNNQGFISKLNKKGEIIELKWIEGINAPKGMGVYGSKLYVSDIDRIAVIDRTKGKVIEFIEVPGSVFLNDISVSNSGLVAISDMKKQTIHIVENDKLIKSMVNDKFNYVNGLFWDNEVLMAGTGGIIYKVNVETELAVPFISETGGIDGLEKVDDQRFVISDWSGKIQLVSAGKAPIELLNTTSLGINAADIGFDIENKIVYVPTFFHNTVAAYKLIEK